MDVPLKIIENPEFHNMYEIKIFYLPRWHHFSILYHGEGDIQNFSS
jgi:hypothetical protein